MMKLLKHIAKAVLPDHLFEKLAAKRSRSYQMKLLKREGLLYAAERYIERYGSTVRYGPFAGMIYPLDAALSRHSIPKLLGTYEEELHGVLQTISGRQYDVVIDIGSAEGYYAVGLARLLQVEVLAYDPEPMERRYCEMASERNEVSDLVKLRDLFHPKDITLFYGKHVLCICDCEGFEKVLFTQETVAHLAKWDLLIELHGDAVEVLPSLPWPHETTVLTMEPRTKRYSELEGLGDPKKLLSEYRGEPQTWLWCSSKKDSGHAAESAHR